MALNMQKMRDRVWVAGVLWDVAQIISPNPHDDFLLLSRSTESVHEGGIAAMDMACVDAHNDDFYPDTPRVRKLVKLVWGHNPAREKAKQELGRIWLSTVMEDA